MSHKCLCWIVLMVLSCGLSGTATCAADTASESSIPDASTESGSYCGLYCVYAALHAYEKRIEFPTLLKVKYIGEMSGSSIQELSLAATDNGLQALAMSGLSRANLVAAQSPIILHVSTPDSPGYYNHWILFLGMENGLAKVVDAPHKPELIPVADVLARWDGVGLYVSDQLPSARMLKMEAICTGENLALAAGLLVLVSRSMARSGTQRRSSELADDGDHSGGCGRSDRCLAHSGGGRIRPQSGCHSHGHPATSPVVPAQTERPRIGEIVEGSERRGDRCALPARL